MKRHTGTNESNEKLPKWTLVETRDTPCFNAALSSCEIAHLAFIKIAIVFHARCCLCGRFSVITIHLGFIKKKGILSDYLKIFTWQHNVRATGSVLCFDRILQMQDFITSFFSWVSNDTGLIHRCNTDKIWITTLVVLQRSLEHIRMSAAHEHASLTRKSSTEKMCQFSTFLIGNSHSLWHVWITNKALRIMPYVILALLNSNQMSLAV